MEKVWKAKLRRDRLGTVIAQGNVAWKRVEAEIESRTAQGYDRAVAILSDPRETALEEKALPAFERRITDIRLRHARKPSLINKIDRMDSDHLP